MEKESWQAYERIIMNIKTALYRTWKHTWKASLMRGFLCFPPIISLQFSFLQECLIICNKIVSCFILISALEVLIHFIQTYHSRTGLEPLDLRKSRDLSPPLFAAAWAAAAAKLLLQLLLKNPFPDGPLPGPLGPPPSINAVVAVSLSLKYQKKH